MNPQHDRHARQIEPLISLYQDNEASPAQRRTVEQVLATCPECQAVLQSYQGIRLGLRDYMNSVPAKTQDYRAFSQKIRRNGSVLPTKPLFSSQPNFVFRLSGLAAAFLLVVSLAAYLMLAGSTNFNPLTPTAILLAVNETPTVAPTATAAPTALAPLPTATLLPIITVAQPTSPAVVAIVPPIVPTIVPVAPPSPTATPPATAILPASTVTQKPLATVRVATVVPSPTTVPTRIPTATPTNLPKPTDTPVIAPSPTIIPSPTTVPTATPTPIDLLPPTAVPTLEVPTVVVPTPTALPILAPAIEAPGLIAYVSNLDNQIHTMRSNGSDDKIESNPALLKEVVWEQLVWSNDARWLAAVGLNKDQVRGIYLIDAQSSGKIEYLVEGIAPVWSPDSRWIAYLAGPITVRSGGIKQGSPSVLNLKKREVTILSPQVETLAPQWFDDGNRLLLGQNRIYDLAKASTSLFNLPSTSTDACLAVSLSPQGNRLATLEAVGSIVQYDLSSGSPVLLGQNKTVIQIKVDQSCGAQRLKWTFDSQYVYYPTGENTQCLVSLQAGISRCLAGVYEPSFSSDTKFLVDYLPQAGGGGSIYAMSSNISQRPTNLRLLAETRIAPAWQPVP